jgi:hypothetical protein
VGGLDGLAEGRDRGRCLAVLFLGAAQVGEVVRFGRGKAEPVRRLRRMSQVDDGVGVTPLALRQAAEHALSMVERPLVTERSQQTQRLVTGVLASGQLAEGDQRPR